MARMGHDSERAALIYQHQARGADKIITDSIDAHVGAEQQRNDDDGPATALVLATSLFGDVAAALREHRSATLDQHCCQFRRRA